MNSNIEIRHDKENELIQIIQYNREIHLFEEDLQDLVTELTSIETSRLQALYEDKLSTNESEGQLLQRNVQALINLGITLHKNSGFKENELSDGWHTFEELYTFRKMYNAALFNEWGKWYSQDGFGGVTIGNNPGDKHKPKYNVHKSWKHNDGEWCFGSEKKWFIVSAMLPTGLISNHYKAEDWELFMVPEVEKALYEFDGHTGSDVLERLKNLI